MEIEKRIVREGKLAIDLKVAKDAKDMDMFSKIRSISGPILNNIKGPIRPVAFIEDAAVHPGRLPQYIKGLRELFAKYHVDAGKRIADMGARYLVALGEHGAQVIEGACQGGMDRTQTRLAANRAEMIDALKANVRGNDIVLLKGSRKVALDTVVEAMKGFYGISKG